MGCGTFGLAAHLATLTHYQVAAAILLHIVAALWAGLGVSQHPVARLAVAADLKNNQPKGHLWSGAMSYSAVPCGAFQRFSTQLVISIDIKKTQEGVSIAVLTVRTLSSQARHRAQVQGECGMLPHLKQKETPQGQSGSTYGSSSTYGKGINRQACWYRQQTRRRTGYNPRISR